MMTVSLPSGFLANALECGNSWSKLISLPIQAQTMWGNDAIAVGFIYDATHRQKSLDGTKRWPSLPIVTWRRSGVDPWQSCV